MEGEDLNGGDNEHQPFNAAFHESGHAPRYRTNARPQYHRGEENPYYESYGNRLDEATKWVRIEVPDFHGKLDPYAFEDWLTSLEDYFEWFGLALELQVRFVKMKFKGQVRVWWQSVEEHLHRLRQPPIADWDEMKLKLQEKYLPVDYEEFMFEELLLLRQGNSSVEEFTNKFHELSIRSRVFETGRQTIARYKAGLREDIKKELIVRLVRVEEAYQLALKVEQQLRNNSTRRTFQGWGNLPSHSTTNTTKRSISSGQECFSNRGVNQADRSTVERDDRKGKAVMNNQPERGKEECYRCGGRGHYAVVCPTKDQKFTLICGETEPQTDSDEPQPVAVMCDDHNTDIPEEILECSNLSLCVIRRILARQKKQELEEDDWLRNNIF